MEKKKCLADGCMNTTTNELGIVTCEFTGSIITELSTICDKFDAWEEEKKEEEKN